MKYEEELEAIEQINGDRQAELTREIEAFRGELLLKDIK